MSLHNYIVSLLTAKERRLHIQQEFDSHSIPFKFFDAITPGNALDKAMQEFVPSLAVSHFSPGEKACFMSHVLLWQKCIDDNLPYIGIFEDDIVLGRDAGIFLGQDQWLKERFHDAFIIKCETYLMDVSLIPTTIAPITTHHQFGTAQKTISYQFPLLNSLHYGTAGYIISQQAAKHLLERIKTLSVQEINPIDHIMFDRYDLISSITTYQLSPAICVQQDCLQPSIKNTNLGSKLEDERNQYRAIREQVATVSNNENFIPHREREIRTSIPFEPPSTQHRDQENPIKLSVIIPIYNAEPYLAECLDSILNQTLKEIEIICINDGSPDNSAAILNAYAQKDSRIVVINKQQNEGTLLARKAGMLAARGQYTTFIDPDDYYTTNQSLETIYDQIVLEGVDILMFKMVALRDQQVITSWQQTLFCQESFDGTKNLLYGLINKKYNWMLANKIFLTELCKKACPYIENTHLVIAEDLYIYCLVAYFAKNFKGMTYEPIYSYRLGIGVSTSGSSTKRILQDITAINVVSRGLHAFISKQPHIFPEYQKVINAVEDFLLEVFTVNLVSLNKDNQELLYEHKFLCHELFRRENFCIRFAQKLSAFPTTESIKTLIKTLNTINVVPTSSEIKTLEIYTTNNQSSYLQQCLTIFNNLRYQVNIAPFPSPLSNNVSQNISKADCVILCAQDEYTPSAKDIINILLQGKRCIIIDYTKFVMNQDDSLLLTYSLADYVVVTNTQLKQRYYQNIGINAIFLPPLHPYSTGLGSSIKKTDEIVWLGFADTIQKYGVEFLHIIPSILKFSNQSRFAIDSFDDLPAELRHKTLDFIQKHTLSDNIIWLKPKDILPHAQTAHILLVTSQPTNYSETILAAKVTGTPSVIGLESLNDNCIDWYGSISFIGQNTTQLVVSIHRLIMDLEYYNILSTEARSFIDEYYSNPEKKWGNLLQHLSHNEHNQLASTFCRPQATFWRDIQHLHSQVSTPSQTALMIKNFSIKTYLKYKILSKVTWGSRKKRYQQLFAEQFRLYDLIKNPR